jgi:hypothetical protein
VERVECAFETGVGNPLDRKHAIVGPAGNAARALFRRRDEAFRLAPTEVYPVTGGGLGRKYAIEGGVDSLDIDVGVEGLLDHVMPRLIGCAVLASQAVFR